MRNLIIPLLVCIACAVVVSITAVTVRTEQIANVENEKKNKIISFYDQNMAREPKNYFNGPMNIDLRSKRV